MLINYCGEPELADVLLRLLVNLTSPTLLLFRADLPKDGAGRRTYLDLIEISHTYKEAFALSAEIWETLAARLQTIMNIVSPFGIEGDKRANRFLCRTSVTAWKSKVWFSSVFSC